MSATSLRLPLTLAMLAVMAGCGVQPMQPDAATLAELSAGVSANATHGMGARYEGTKGVAFDEPGGQAEAMAALPATVDLRAQCPPVYDQGKMESCTGFAVAKGLGEFILKKQHRHQELSALFTYYHARRLTEPQYREQINVTVDSGALIHNAVETLDNLGAVPEATMPYPKLSVLSPETKLPFVQQKPGTGADKEAKSFRLIRGRKAITSLRGVRKSLADGIPVVCGMLLYDSIKAESTRKLGKLPLPDLKKEKFRGGHAVLIVGYDNKKQHLIVRNSWGKEWGDKGYFYLPYDYFRGTDPNIEDGHPFVFDGWTVTL